MLVMNPVFFCLAKIIKKPIYTEMSCAGMGCKKRGLAYTQSPSLISVQVLHLSFDGAKHCAAFSGREADKVKAASFGLEGM